MPQKHDMKTLKYPAAHRLGSALDVLPHYIQSVTGGKDQTSGGCSLC